MTAAKRKPRAVRKTKKKRQYPEFTLQVKIADVYRLYYPQVLWFAVPNGGNRSPQDGKRFKQMGVRAGVFDIVIAEPTPLYPGMFLEVKAPGTGGGDKGLSDKQITFQAEARARGYYCVTVDSLYDAVTELENYMGFDHAERISLRIGDYLRREIGDTTV